jgi:hypothetical protein
LEDIDVVPTRMNFSESMILGYYFQGWHHLCKLLIRRLFGVKKKTVQSGLSGNRQNWMDGSSQTKSNSMNQET